MEFVEDKAEEKKEPDKSDSLEQSQVKKLEAINDVKGDVENSDMPASKKFVEEAERNDQKQAEELEMPTKKNASKEAEEEVMTKEEPANTQQPENVPVTTHFKHVVSKPRYVGNRGKNIPFPLSLTFFLKIFVRCAQNVSKM